MQELIELSKKIDILKEQVTKESEDITKFINPDKLLANPEQHLLEIAKEFAESYQDEMEKAEILGRQFAEKILRKVK
tara:strand:+ start:12799 stop:13029 length:231 start_codon:yes stop_codon:yes gene_type:complete